MMNKSLLPPLSILAFLSLFFTQNAPAQTYCASKGTAPWTEWISNVQIGSINNASQKEGYGNFTSQTVSLARGSSTTLTVTQGFSWAADPSIATQQGRAWIDFNKNGTFEDTEIVGTFTRNNATANVAIPATATNGTTRMRISLKTNGLPTACETFDKGEVEDYTVNITGGGNVPDLTLANLTVVDEVVQQGQNLNWKVDVKNIGLGNATGNFTVKAYISTDSQLDANDVQAGAITVPNLAAGATNLQMAGTSLIPANLALRFYFLILSVDADQNFIEFNENNNVLPSVSIFTVKSSSLLPDLIINNFTRLDLTAQQGGKLLFDYAASNIGTVTVTGRFKNNFYLSTDQTLDANDILSGSVMSVRDIMVSPPFAYFFNDSLTVPATLAIGNYYLILKIDADNQIVESDETNNTIVSLNTVNITGGTVGGTPNLAITNVTGPTTALPGSQVSLVVTMRNTGTAPSAATNLYYNIFNNNTAPSRVSNSTTAVAPLAPNETRVVNFVATLNNPIIPPNAKYFTNADFNPYSFGDYAVFAQASPIPMITDAQFKFNIAPIFPQANISVTVTPNKTSLATGERWNATYTVTNNSAILAKQVFVNLGNFANFGRNFFPGLYAVDSSSNTTATSRIVSAGAESPSYGWEVLDLAAGETRTVKLNFSGVITQPFPSTPPRTTLPFPTVNAFSNIINTNTTVGAPITIFYDAAPTNLPDLTLANLTIPTPSVQQGNILSFRADFKNIGTAAATGNFTVKSYLSLDQFWSPEDYANGNIPTANYGAGQTVAQVAGAMLVSNTLSAGNYYLILRIDPENNISESNENNNVIVSANTVNVTAIGGGTCFNKFQINTIYPTAGQCTDNNLTQSEFGTFQMLGTRIADGFAAYLRFPNQFDFRLNIFTKAAPTTTPPAGTNFRTCTSLNWQYFIVDGYTQDERFTNIVNNTYYRVAYFGSETNPDSIIIESQQPNGGNSTIFKSASKSLNCNTCVTNDRAAPVFNCPTTTITYSQPFSPDALRIENIINLGFTTPGTNIQATDNCNAPLVGFKYINNVYWGGVYPISLVAFDSAGNKATCNFNLKIPCSPSVFGPRFSNCPTNISLQAATGQACATATWTPPIASNGGSPVSVSSNFASGACFPVGTTAVVYTAKDSCGFTTACSFNVTVTGSTTGGAYCASKSTAPWEYAVSNVQIGTLNNTSDKFKDFATLGYSDFTNLSTTLNKGQTYPLSITPLLSWIGNLPNAYCRVWIDFNQNKTFEANELVLEKTNQNPLTQSVLIPTTALTGNTRMRVSLKNGAYPTACETFEKGEVEDYSVQITEGGVLCNNVTNAGTIAKNCVGNTVQIGNAAAATGGTGALEYRWIQWTNNCPSHPQTPNNVSFIPNSNTENLPAGSITPNFRFYTRWARRAGCTESQWQPANCIEVLPTDCQTTNQPDLTLSNLTIPTPSLQQGQILNFKADFKNIGTAAATGNFTVKSYLSSDNVLSANDYADGIVPTANYAAGLTVSQVAAAMTVNSTVAAGQYYLILKIDADNQITESNESNNVIVSTGLITVTGTTGGGGSDIALTLTSTPSVYRQYTTQNFRITATNSGTTAFSNVKIKFTRPALTVAGGTKVASIGTFSDYCVGGLECSEWTIPTLAGGTTATLDMPLFVLNPTAALTASATLLSSTPVDNSAGNNTATVTINSANAPIISPLIAQLNSSINSKPTALNPVIIHKINPTIADNFIVVESESYLNQGIDYQIVNSLGTTVSTGKLMLEKGINKQHIDVAQLPKGLYFIQTYVGKGRNVPTKFVKI